MIFCSIILRTINKHVYASDIYCSPSYLTNLVMLIAYLATIWRIDDLNIQIAAEHNGIGICLKNIHILMEQI